MILSEGSRRERLPRDGRGRRREWDSEGCRVVVELDVVADDCGTVVGEPIGKLITGVHDEDGEVLEVGER